MSKLLGGTELQLKMLKDSLDPDLYNKFNFYTKEGVTKNIRGKNILYAHETVEEGRFQFLSNPNYREDYAHLVFVSNYQFNGYNKMLGVPYKGSSVLENAIEIFPNEVLDKPKGKIKLIYTPMINRGLELLVPVFNYLAGSMPDYDMELDVYSSFKLYGWEQRDKPYEKLIEACKDHPKINYHGSVPNDVVRKALTEAHIFVYPSIYEETSCRTLMEAMSAGCVCIHPNKGALVETAGGLTTMYPFTEDAQEHCNRLASILMYAIQNYASVSQNIRNMKFLADQRFNWELRKLQWESLLTSLV